MGVVFKNVRVTSVGTDQFKDGAETEWSWSTDGASWSH